MKVRIVEAAWRDLEDIAVWVAQDRPSAALRLYDDLVETAKTLVPMPARFPLLEGFEHLGLRRCSVPPYSILFKIEGASWVSVVRIVHDARDFPRLFSG